jgi:hypothetical protein
MTSASAGRNWKDLKLGKSDRGHPQRPAEYVSTAKVFDMLMAVPKFGRVKRAAS